MSFGCGKAGGRESLLGWESLLGLGGAEPSEAPLTFPDLLWTSLDTSPIKVIVWALEATLVALADHVGTVYHVYEWLMIGLVEQGCLGGGRGLCGGWWNQQTTLEAERVHTGNKSVPQPSLCWQNGCWISKAERTREHNVPWEVAIKRVPAPHPLLRILWIYDVSTVWAQHIAVWWATIRSVC